MTTPERMLLVLGLTLACGCCTQEMAASVGKAARDSFFQEQERQQQRFLQVQADALKDIITTLREAVDDPRTRQAVRGLADELTATADGKLRESIAGLTRTVDEQQGKLRQSLLATTDEVALKANETFKRTLKTAIADARAIIQEQPVLDEARREELHKSIQPLVDQIIADAGEQARVAVQKNVDALSLPLLAATGALLALAILTMGLPSILLFMSYRRSTLAIQALRAVAERSSAGTSGT